MTNVNILKSLILLSFFVFSLPFFQMCSTLHSEESPEEYIGEQKINKKKKTLLKMELQQILQKIHQYKTSKKVKKTALMNQTTFAHSVLMANLVPIFLV